LNTLSITLMTDIKKDITPYLKGDQFDEGERKTFELISVKVVPKQTLENGVWKDVIRKVERYDRETKKLIMDSFTPEAFAIKMIETNDESCFVRNIKLQSDIATKRFREILGDKKRLKDEFQDVAGMKVVFESLRNEGYPPSVVPLA